MIRHMTFYPSNHAEHSFLNKSPIVYYLTYFYIIMSKKQLIQVSIIIFGLNFTYLFLYNSHHIFIQDYYKGPLFYSKISYNTYIKKPLKKKRYIFYRILKLKVFIIVFGICCITIQ